jgi:hypothetical protein
MLPYLGKRVNIVSTLHWWLLHCTYFNSLVSVTMHLSSASCSVMPFDVSGGTLKIRVKCSVSVMVCLGHLKKNLKLYYSWTLQITNSRKYLECLIQRLSPSQLERHYFIEQLASLFTWPCHVMAGSAVLTTNQIYCESGSKSFSTM